MAMSSAGTQSEQIRTRGGSRCLDTSLASFSPIRIANNSAVTVENTKGVFRLSSNEQGFSINEASFYGISFGAMEAL